jgi:hypothetical protein
MNGRRMDVDRGGHGHREAIGFRGTPVVGLRPGDLTLERDPGPRP